jgi:DNA gyrase subunit B
LSQRLRELSFLNRGILITLEDERDGKKHRFQYEGGIASFVEHLNRNKETMHPVPIFIEGTRDEITVELALPMERRVRREHLLLRQQHQHP